VRHRSVGLGQRDGSRLLRLAFLTNASPTSATTTTRWKRRTRPTGAGRARRRCGRESPRGTAHDGPSPRCKLAPDESLEQDESLAAVRAAIGPAAPRPRKAHPAAASLRPAFSYRESRARDHRLFRGAAVETRLYRARQQRCRVLLAGLTGQPAAQYAKCCWPTLPAHRYFFGPERLLGVHEHRAF